SQIRIFEVPSRETMISIRRRGLTQRHTGRKEISKSVFVPLCLRVRPVYWIAQYPRFLAYLGDADYFLLPNTETTKRAMKARAHVLGFPARTRQSSTAGCGIGFRRSSGRRSTSSMTSATASASGAAEREIFSNRRAPVNCFTCLGLATPNLAIC